MENNINGLEMMSKDELIDLLQKMMNGGVSLSFNGKRTAQVIQRKVMPRVVKINKKLSFNDENGKCKNLIIDGENLQGMVTLYKYKGTVDLILTDPPYNTGKDFRYNDKWDTDPNDPELGSLVTLEDGSRHTKWIKFTQVIGRVLRQPGIRHYPDEKLNMANFYIKTDEKDIFKTIIEEIQKTLAIDIPEISITYRDYSARGKEKATIKPTVHVEVPDVAVNSEDAEADIVKLLKTMNDYRNDSDNTVGTGSTIKAIAIIGEGKTIKETEIETSHSNMVSARWIFKRELEKLAKGATTLCDYSMPKFDALIEYSSNAATHIKDYAKKIADVYRSKSKIVQNSLDTTEVGEVFVGTKYYEFKNSVHPRYSDFNSFELAFARELDKTGNKWLRNPQSGFFSIPLLDGKGTNNFNPDFVVWTKNTIFALDTKGSHLIQTDSERKLFFIENVCEEGPNLEIRLISESKYNDKCEVIEKTGYTIWKVKQGRVCPIYYDTLSEAVTNCLVI